VLCEVGIRNQDWIVMRSLQKAVCMEVLCNGWNISALGNIKNPEDFTVCLFAGTISVY